MNNNILMCLLPLINPKINLLHFVIKRIGTIFIRSNQYRVIIGRCTCYCCVCAQFLRTNMIWCTNMIYPTNSLFCTFNYFMGTIIIVLKVKLVHSSKLIYVNWYHNIIIYIINKYNITILHVYEFCKNIKLSIKFGLLKKKIHVQ